MEKNLKDYLHFYIGCEFMFSGTKDTTLYTLDYERFALINEDDDFKEITLVLRKLFDITGEEVRELLYMQYVGLREKKLAINFGRRNRPDETTNYPGSIEYSLHDENSGQHVMSGTFSFQSLNAEIFKSLLEKGFDMFGLINSGCAVDKETYEI